MKRRLLTTVWLMLLTSVFAITAMAQTVTVSVDNAGGLYAALEAKGITDFTTVKSLTVTGTLNSTDFLVIKNVLKNLENLDISDTDVKQIPSQAFYEKGMLKTLRLPEKISKFGDHAFSYCQQLQSITFGSQTAVAGKIVFPASLRSVEYNAFDNCQLLTHLDFSACTGLEYLGSSAFQNLCNLTEVLFPSQGNLHLEWYCFQAGQIWDESSGEWVYKGLETLTLTKALTYLSGWSLPRTLKTLYVESSTPPSCDNQTFEELAESSLKVYIPKGSKLNYIIANGWGNLSQFEETGFLINISGYGSVQQGSATYVNGDVLFAKGSGATTLKAVPETMEGSVLSVKLNGNAVSVAADGTFTIPAGTTTGTIDVAFSATPFTINNPNGGELKELIAAAGRTPSSIIVMKVTGKMANKDWNYIKGSLSALKELDLSETDAKVVPEQALQEHQRITVIHLPSTVTTISSSAFYNCNQLTTVDGCEHVKDIQNGAFTACSKLSNFPFGNELQSIDDCFVDCTSLPEKLVLPASVYSIGWASTFRGSSVREFDLSQCHLTQDISQWIFGAATSVLLPEYGSYRVDLKTFEGSEITELSIPACVTYLGEYFVPATLERVYARSVTPIQANASAFSNVGSTCVLYVPVGSINAYAEATGWSEFTNIQECGLQVIVGDQGKVRVGTQTLMGTTSFFSKESSATFEIVANAGWHADNVTLNGTAIAVTKNKFTLSGDQLNGKLAVAFAANQFDLQLQITGNGKVKLGSLEYTASQTLRVDSLATLNFALEPAAGLVVSAITFNGQESVVQNGGTTYVTPAITANSTLAITFGTAGAGGSVATYTVTTGEGGTVEYKNTTLLPQTTIQVPKNQNAVFTMKPDQYYLVDAVKLNGQNVTNQLDADGKLTVTNVSADATLDVTFRVSPELILVMEYGGNLTNMLSATQKQNVTKLTVKGPMIDQDFFAMRDEMPQLATIDLWEAEVEYIPYMAFCTTQSWNGSSVGKKTLTSVRLPERTTQISDFAFAGCTNLKEVNFTALKNLQYLNSSAFESTNLQVIDLSNTKLTELYSAFKNVKSLENIKFPQTLTKLGDVFYQSDVSEIDLSGYTNLKILERTFYQCKNLVKVTLPEGLLSINNSAFQECSSLTTINFPKSLQSIGGSAFSSTELQKVDLSGLTELQVIGESAFNYCLKLTEVLFPSSLTQLGNCAFWNCNALTSIDLSKTQLQTIPEYAFVYCYSLESVKMPKSLETIDRYAFGWDNKLGGVLELGPSFTSVGELAFANTQISVVRSEATTPPVLNSNSMPGTWITAFVPEGYAEVYKNAAVWEDRVILDREVHAEVTVSKEGNLAIDINEQAGVAPALVTHLKVHGPLGVQDFNIMRENMTVLYDLDMSDATVNFIPENAFNSVKKKVLMNVKLPASLLRIEQYAFYGCSSLKGSLTLPTNLTFIGYGAFQGCSSLEEVVFNQKLEAIQGYAFEGCSSLAQELTLPLNLQSLGERTFANCSSLYGTVKFNYNFYMFMGAEGYGSSAGQCFENCSKIEKVDLSQLDDFFAEIPYRTFAGCSSLTTVLLPPALARIDNEAFADCASLDGIEFPNTMQVINWGAFQNCSSLRSIDLSDCKNFGTIEGYAFNNCSSLETVYLPKSLNWIREYAFADCRKLANLTVEALQPADLGEYVFRHVHTDRCVLSIPTGTFYDYLSAAQWGEFVSMRKSIDVTVGEGANLYFFNDIDDEFLAPALDPSFAPANAPRRTSAAEQQGAMVKDGSSLYVQENEKAIFRVNPDENVQIAKVLYNGQDVTNQMVNGTFQTPGVTAASSFEVQVNVVGDIHVKELRMLDDEVAVKMGENRQVKYAVYPTNATNKSITWTSSNTDIATVSADGVVTGKAAGHVELTAKTVDGGLEQKCEIIVMSNNYWIVMDNAVDDYVENNVTMSLALHNEGEARDIQFDVYMPEGVSMNDNGTGDYGIQMSGRSNGHQVVAARTSDGSAVRVIVYSQDGNALQGNDGELLTLPFVTGENVGNFNVIIKNIHVSGPDNFDFDAPNHTIQFKLKDYLLGDSNGSGEVNISDVVNTVDQILERGSERFVKRAADVNKDDRITVADVTATVDIVLERTNPNLAPRIGSNDTQGRLYMDDLSVARGEEQTIGLKIENAGEFIAFQCDVYLPSGMNVARDENGEIMAGLANGVTSSHVISANLLESGILRLLVMSPQNERFSILEDAILNLTVTTDDMVADGSTIDIRDIRLIRDGNGEYQAPDAWAYVHCDTPTGIDNRLSKELKIRTEGHYLIVESSVDTILQMASVDGVSRNLEVRAGENRFFIENAGVYVIRGKKIFIK